jgi:hypothetical protein
MAEIIMALSYIGIIVLILACFGLVKRKQPKIGD